MEVLIAGANGQIGRRLVALMAESHHGAHAMVRDPAQIETLQALGAAEVAIANLEGDCSTALTGCDAVVFTAGSGAHTGPEKTEDVDKNGAINLINQAAKANVRRFIIVSSMRADAPETGPENMRHYFAAKQAADDHLRASGLDFTIVRPGKLTEDEGRGRVDIAKQLGRFGEVPRADVAAVLLACLDAPYTVNQHFELLAGDTPIAQALTGICRTTS